MKQVYLLITINLWNVKRMRLALYLADYWFIACLLFLGARGRPAIIISIEQLKILHDQGCTAKKMATIFKCSQQLVYQQLYACNIHQRGRYSMLSQITVNFISPRSAFRVSADKTITFLINVGYSASYYTVVILFLSHQRSYLNHYQTASQTITTIYK